MPLSRPPIPTSSPRLRGASFPILVAVFLLLLGTTARAAEILWAEPVETVAPAVTDIVNTGSTLEAINYGPASGTLTINGVVFTNQAADVGNWWDPGPYSGDPDYDEMLQGARVLSFGPGVTGTLTLSGLTPGNSYLVQLVNIHDQRPCCGNRSYEIDDESEDYVDAPVVSRNTGGYVVGLFVADGTSQTIRIRSLGGVDNNDPALAAYLVADAPDSDGDGLPDLVETNTGIWQSPFDTGTDPTLPDSDGDGLFDGEESNTFVDGGPSDPGTDPNRFDTDYDGVGDGAEVAGGSSAVDLRAQPLLQLSWVSIRDAGNAADVTGYGAVAEDFLLGRFEITNRQYAIFLNSVAASDPRSLWNANMLSIQRVGADGSYVYRLDPAAAEVGVDWISHWDAARFVNWLSNGQPTGAQDASTTEDGTYTLSGSTESVTGLVARQASPDFFLPNEDQWYKAAYHLGGGSYAGYPFGSSTPPTCAAPGPGTDRANCDRVVGAPTEVGGYPDTTGPVGQSDQGGNLQEWVEYPGTGLAITRGGDWFSGVADMASTSRAQRVAFDASFNTGFRIAALAPAPLGGSESTQNPNIPRQTCQSDFFFSDEQRLSAISCTVTPNACNGNPYCSNDGSSCSADEDCSGLACAETLGACTTDADCPPWDSCGPATCVDNGFFGPIGVCDRGGAYCSDDTDCPPDDIDGFCSFSGNSCVTDGDCVDEPGDFCESEVTAWTPCVPTTCKFSADEDIPQYSWKFDPDREPFPPGLNDTRWTGIIDDPVQSRVDIRDGIPFDPSGIGIGECLFDEDTTFRNATIAFVPQTQRGFQCCSWEAYCAQSTCGNTSGILQFKWGDRQDEVPHDVDGDQIPTQCGDNCPLVANPDQADLDGDGVGAACDPDDSLPSGLNVPPDSDGDGWRDPVDNCPDLANPEQIDSNGDFVGNLCQNVPEPGFGASLMIGTLGLCAARARTRRRASRPAAR